MAGKLRQTAARKVVQLDQRLTGYPLSATRAPGRRTGNWPIYAAATGSALAMATGASASIITGTYSGGTVHPVPGTTHLSEKSATFHLGTDHVVLRANSGTSAGQHSAMLSVQGIPPVQIFETSKNHQAVRNFFAGSKIGSGAGPRTSTARIVNAFISGKQFGVFTSGKTGYAGLALKTTGGQFDYGWLKLVFTNNPASGLQYLPYDLTALAYGIETTPGQSINAGQTMETPSAPEPGTAALALLSSGAAGVLALRRRRKHKSGGS